jgi:hypothetical protein
MRGRRLRERYQVQEDRVVGRGLGSFFEQEKVGTVGTVEGDECIYTVC